MKNLKVYNIASINVKTQGNNFKGARFPIGERNVQILADFIQEEDLFSVGTQELTYLHQETLARLLSSNYVVSGGYRFGNGKILEKIPYNESNAIIMKKDAYVGLTKTFHIPSIPTFRDIWATGPSAITKLQPRILTSELALEELIFHINTHLHDAFHQKERSKKSIF